MSIIIINHGLLKNCREDIRWCFLMVVSQSPESTWKTLSYLQNPVYGNGGVGAGGGDVGGVLGVGGGVGVGGLPDQGGISQVLQQHLAGYPRETGEVRGRSSCCNLEATLTRQP